MFAATSASRLVVDSQAWPQTASQADKESQRQPQWAEAADARPCANCDCTGRGWSTKCLACAQMVCEWCRCYHEPGVGGISGATRTTTAHSLCLWCGGPTKPHSTAVDQNWSMTMVRSTDALAQMAQEGRFFWCVNLHDGGIFQWWRWMRSVTGVDATSLWGAAGQHDFAQHAQDGSRRVLHFSAAMPASDRMPGGRWGF